MALIYKIGSRGTMVKQIQRALCVVGYRVIEDGIYGKITREAVIAYQKDNGLTADGIVGPATIAKLFAGKLQNTLGLKKSKRKITEIIVHCTASYEGRDYTVEQIRKDHLKRGFSDIGYHYVIYRDGSLHEGRNVDCIGAHALNHNAYSIGVCYVGGLEPYKPGVPYNKHKSKDTRTPEQKIALKSLLENLRILYPEAKILGHRDTSPDLNGDGLIEPSEWIKDCPSFDVSTEYGKI